MNKALLVLILVAHGAMARAEDFLPPTENAEAAIAALPSVAAALARTEVSAARAEALRRGPYEYQLSVAPTVRHERIGRTYDEWEAGISRTWRLPGKARIDQELGSTAIESAELAVADVRHAGARQLMTAWFAWLRGAAATALASAQLGVVREQQRAMERRLKRGDVATLDLERADLAVAQAESIVERAVLEREQARIELAQQFPSLELPAAVPEVPAPALRAVDEEALVARIVGRSHEIELARSAAHRQALVAQRAAADRKPDPTLGLRIIDEVDHDEQAVSLVFSIPLAGGMRAANALAETNTVTAAEAEAAAVARMIESSARQLARAIASRQQVWRVSQRALATAKVALRRMERAWQMGEIGFMELSMARRDEQQAAHTELMARLDAQEALLQAEIDSHERWMSHAHGATASPAMGTRVAPDAAAP